MPDLSPLPERHGRVESRDGNARLKSTGRQAQPAGPPDRMRQSHVAVWSCSRKKDKLEYRLVT
jgi:hypothetical protein